MVSRSLSQRALLDGGCELAGDTEVDVGLEQGHADFSEGGVYVLFGEPALVAELVEYAVEFL